MWKCFSIVPMCLGCLYLVTLKCGNVEICLHCLYLVTLKCGKVPPLSLSVNNGSVEMWRNVSCLYPITLEVWKPGKLEICLGCFNLITLKVWKSGNVSGMIWKLKIGLAHGKMTGVTSDCCQSQDSYSRHKVTCCASKK